MSCVLQCEGWDDGAAVSIVDEVDDLLGLERVYERFDLCVVFMSALDGDDVCIQLRRFALCVLDPQRVFDLATVLKRIVAVDDRNGA